MHTLLNNGWSFALLPTGSTSDEARRAVFEPVDLPHDWLIHDPDRLYESGDGWYRRGLTLSESDLAGHVFLSFDGVYMDTDVYLNGTLLLTERYGYAPFQVDLTPFALAGANEILLHVRYLSPNSRWYSGAGIFRDVELLLLPETCFVPDGICAQTIWESDGSWSLRISAEILGSQKVEAAFFLLDGDQTIVSATSDAQARIALRLPCPGVMPWSPKCPKCYTLVCSLGDQKETVVIGFRHITLDPERGLFLNQTSVKLHGVCLHHDLGCLGAAFHPEAAERQLTCLMSIGVNAIRTSHNPPARAFLDLCDRLGLLVMDEAFDMWEGPKTRYDYARFFAAHAGEDLRRMVRRDRNHPCVIFWSIGNEIQDTHLSPAAPRMTRFLRDTVRASDGGHAPITIGSNYMPWKGAQRCADVLKIAGYNYAEKLYASHHAAHPEWVIYGSETASVLSSRGIYHFPISASILSDEDEQCSALGNSVTSWGHQYLPRMLADDLNCPWTLGQFVWSGTDYIGEPTPYHTRSSYFGLFDTACLPKDSAYLYRAAWTDSPFVHIGVSWSWNEGQMIDVPVMTNADAVELFLGDTSLGKREVCMRDPEKALPVWHLPFQPLPLRAVIETNGEKGKKVIEDVRWPYGDCDHLHVLRESAPAGALAFLQVEARDREDHPVENAVNLVTVRTRGPIRVLGMDNGDSTDHDGYLTLGKRLFSGRLLIVLQATAETGEGVVTLASEGLRDVQLTLPLNAAFRGTPPEGSLKPFPVRDTRLYARAIRLTPMGSTTLTPQHPSVTFTVSVLPENSFPQPITYRVTNTAGIDSPCAKVEVRQDQGTVTVLGCGDGDLFLRATVTNGDTHARVISTYDLHLTGFGLPYLDPYAFVAGGLYTVHLGEITPGNDHGIAFARDGVSMAGFTDVDFGEIGSDRITIPIFALDSQPHVLRLYLGVPGEDGRLLTELTYQKPSRWNVYQEETWQLPEILRGLQTLCFETDAKIHFGGFSFERQSRTSRLLTGLDADEVWGDDFRRDGTRIRHIGNNVTLTFRNMAFDEDKAELALTGETPLNVQPVHVHIRSDTGEETAALLSFVQTEGETTQSFSLSVPLGLCTLSLIFLPGSNFTFVSMKLDTICKETDAP